ncbi:MAG: hypothetical protein MI920_04765, partial [Kiloniellales bacterium]|nr:hypothetical protein [Kiloniellales bacterium]
MREWFTLGELADSGLPGLPKSNRGLTTFAEREGWDNAVTLDGQPLARRRAGRGGGQEYHYKVLPRACRLHLIAAAHKAGDAVAARPAATVTTIEPEPEGFTEHRALRRDAKLAILGAFDRFQKGSDLSVKAALQAFTARYNEGAIELPDWVRAAKRSISVRSLARWRAERRGGHLHGLGGRYKSRKGSGLLDRANGGEVALFIAALIVKQPRLTGDTSVVEKRPNPGTGLGDAEHAVQMAARSLELDDLDGGAVRGDDGGGLA